MRGAWEQHVPAPPWFTEAISDTGRAATATVDGRRIAYRRWGDPGNHTAVLIHGGAAHAHWWDHIAPLLAAEREVIAFDLSGHGDSEHQSHYSVARWASEALAISSLTSSPKPVLIGHSLGGIVALEAARAGADLGGVVIIDSPIVNATPEEKAATERLAFGPAHLYPSRDEILARFRPVPAQPTIHYVESYIAGTSVRQVPGGWTWKFDPRVFDRSPHLPDLEPLNCRSALMRGEHGMISPSMAAQIYEGLGKVTQMIAVPQSGHHIMLDQPLALVTGLRAILAEWDQRTRTRFAS